VKEGFEYLDTFAGLDERNRLGAEGWELVCVTRQLIRALPAQYRNYYHFKRRIESNMNPHPPKKIRK